MPAHYGRSRERDCGPNLYSTRARAGGGLAGHRWMAIVAHNGFFFGLEAAAQCARAATSGRGSDLQQHLLVASVCSRRRGPSLSGPPVPFATAP